MLSVLLLLLQTVPGNITKVPRASLDLGLCQDVSTLSTLTAGHPYEAVFLVDGLRRDYQSGVTASGYLVPHRYQVLRIWIVPATGTHLSQDATVDDRGPVCPAGTAHAGQRPHQVPLPALTAGVYRVFGMALDRRQHDGSLLEPALLARMPETTLPVTVTVR